MKNGRVRVVAGSRGPATAATDSIKTNFPQGIDPKRKKCFRGVVKTTFLTVLAYHPELRGVPIRINAEDGLSDGSAGKAIYKMGLGKVNGDILVVLAHCGNKKCTNLCPEKQTLTKVCKHECTHLAARRIWGVRKIPSWLEEGYAEWVANGSSGESEAIWIVSNYDMDFSEKDMYQVFQGLNAIHYKLFYLMFVFLSKKRQVRIQDFVRQVGKKGWQKALSSVYGITPEELYRQFFRYLETSKKTAPNFLDSILNGVRGWIQV